MMKFVIVLMILTLMVVPGSAQSDGDVNLIGAHGGQLITVSQGEITATPVELDMGWKIFAVDANAQGDAIYMIANPEGNYFSGSLYLWNGSESILLTENLRANCKPYFADEDHVVYVSRARHETIVSDDPMIITVPVVSHNIHTSDTEEINVFEYSAGGGGGRWASTLMDAVLNAEYATSAWPERVLVLDSPRSEIAECNRHVFLTEDEYQDYQGHVLSTYSPDMRQAVRVFSEVRGERRLLEILDPVNATITDSYDITEWLNTRNLDNESILWSDDGYVYMTQTRDVTPAYSLSLTEAAFLAEQTELDWSQAHHTQILQIDPTDGTIAVIYETYAWGITRLNNADGYLYWAQIPNGDAFIEAYRADNSIANNFDGSMLDENPYVLPDIYRMSLTDIDGTVEQVAEDIQRFIPLPDRQP